MPPQPRNTAACLAALSPEGRAGVEIIMEAIRAAAPTAEGSGEGPLDRTLTVITCP